MDKAKSFMNLASKLLLIIWGCYLLYDGAIYCIYTMGQVVGSEFSMLISLVSIGGKVLVWLALLGFWLGTMPIPVPVVPAKPGKKRK
ncbi:hypothetical protein BerOc1_00520 [Pseudodesulfovibrio hydrargyri]|uniref:Uncharacterized protein n=1 Tax=Pseudodesulfovibrio hydrargyri TaxID=2125990 RepID=A0A1J5NB50_9BACT|nr:hypothetical protein [Pseudodesulfovibrio hydrargyri]OIQ52048.1 hypothetical protein BerOc1_00520 [Pseudodesulfovibrio hydrargyri]